MADFQTNGRAALAAIDRALATQLSKDKPDFMEVTETLCAMRDDLIAACRAGVADHERLGRLNAIISSTLSGHFPLGKISWPLIQSARESLQGLLVPALA